MSINCQITSIFSDIKNKEILIIHGDSPFNTIQEEFDFANQSFIALQEIAQNIEITAKEKINYLLFEESQSNLEKIFKFLNTKIITYQASLFSELTQKIDKIQLERSSNDLLQVKALQKEVKWLLKKGRPSQENRQLLSDLNQRLRKDKTSLKANKPIENTNVYLNEILLNIFSYLNRKEIQRAALMCRQWKKISEYDTLWKNYLETEFSKSILTHKKENESFKNLYFRTHSILHNIEEKSWEETNVNLHKFPTLEQILVIKCRSSTFLLGVDKIKADLGVWDLQTQEFLGLLPKAQYFILGERLLYVLKHENKNKLEVWDLEKLRTSSLAIKKNLDPLLVATLTHFPKATEHTCITEIFESIEGYICTVGNEKWIKVWNMANETCIANFEQYFNENTKVLFLPDNKWLFFNRNELHIWNSLNFQLCYKSKISNFDIKTARLISNGMLLLQWEGKTQFEVIDCAKLMIGENGFVCLIGLSHLHSCYIREIAKGKILAWSGNDSLAVWDIDQIDNQKASLIHEVKFNAKGKIHDIISQSKKMILASHKSLIVLDLNLIKSESPSLLVYQKALEENVLDLLELLPEIVLIALQNGKVQIWDLNRIDQKEDPYINSYSTIHSEDLSLYRIDFGKVAMLCNPLSSSLAIVLKDFSKPCLPIEGVDFSKRDLMTKIAKAFSENQDIPSSVYAKLSGEILNTLHVDNENYKTLKNLKSISSDSLEMVYGFLYEIMKPFTNPTSSSTFFDDKKCAEDAFWGRNGLEATNDQRAIAVELYILFGSPLVIKKIEQAFDKDNINQIRSIFKHLPKKCTEVLFGCIGIFEGYPDGDLITEGERLFRKDPLHKKVRFAWEYFLKFGFNILELKPKYQKTKNELLLLQKALNTEDKKNIQNAFFKLNKTSLGLLNKTLFTLEDNFIDIDIIFRRPILKIQLHQYHLSEALIILERLFLLNLKDMKRSK